jgi:hypothetical protein
VPGAAHGEAPSLCGRPRRREEALTRLSGSVLLSASAVLCGLIPRPGRTGAVPFDTPWRLARVPSPPPLSACIETSPVRGPQAQDAVPLAATRWAEAAARGRGAIPRPRAPDGVCLPAHPAEGGERQGTAGMEQAAAADVQEAVGHDRLEEPAEKRHDVKGSGAEACTAHLTRGAGARAIVAADAALGGDGAPEDRGGEGGEGGVAVVLGPTLDMPGAGPALWGHALPQASVAYGVVAECAGEGGEGVDGDKAVGAGGAPRRAILGEAPARDASVHGGMGLQVPALGGQDTDATREGWPDAALVCGQPCAGRGRRLHQGLGREAWRRAEQGTPGLGDGAGAQAGRPGERWGQGGREPRRGGLRRTRRAGAMATGRRETVMSPTAVARREARAIGSAAAVVEGADARAVRGGEVGRARQVCGRTGGDARAQGGHGRSPGRSAWRRAEASSWPWWGRGQERMGVARGGWPRARWRSRGGTPASRRGVASAGRRGGMATPVVVLPARCLAGRQAPWPRVRRRGEAAAALCVLAPRGGQAPGRVRVGVPGGAQQRAGLCRPGDRPVFGALAPGARDLEALAIEGRDLQTEGCVESESQARDGGAGDGVVPGGGRREEALALLHMEDGGEPVGGGTQERQRGPVTRQDVRREEAAATVTEAQGRRGQAIDVVAVQDSTLPLLCRHAVGGGVGALREQADCPDRGCMRPCACAAEVERRKQVWTQGAQEISPFVRRGVDGRRKTS